jgi:hypothetical protein
MTDVNEVLADREKGYGKFEDLAVISQALKGAFRAWPNWDRLMQDQREALDMIAVKIGRIMNGNPNYADSWVDIAGYAMLVADRLGTAPTEAASEDHQET